MHCTYNSLVIQGVWRCKMKSKEKEADIKKRILEKIEEMIDCAASIDCIDSFEIYVKCSKGVITTKLEFLKLKKQNFINKENEK